MARRRIERSELVIGSVLGWDAYDGAGRLLLRRGHIVSSANQIEALLERGLYTEPDKPRPESAPVRNESAVALILDARERLERLCADNTGGDTFGARIVAVRKLIAE